MSRRFLTVLITGTVAIICSSSTVYAQWNIVKKFVQPQVHFLEESEDLLVLYEPTLGDTLVLTREREPHSDIYGKIVRKRGSNPFRIWYVHKNLASDSSRPRNTWGRFLRMTFLNMLRIPDSKKRPPDSSLESKNHATPIFSTLSRHIDNPEDPVYHFTRQPYDAACIVRCFRRI